jgi:hypothetical protein
MLLGSKNKKSYSRIKSNSEKAVDQAQRATEDIKILEKKVAHLTRICQVFYDMLKETKGFSNEEFMTRVSEKMNLDPVFGEEKVKNCVSCNRPVGKRHKKCLYCGELQPIRTVFDQM